MKKAIFFMLLLALSATTVATVMIASNVSLPVPTNQMQTVLFDADANDIEPLGDPVGGGGKGPT